MKHSQSTDHNQKRPRTDKQPATDFTLGAEQQQLRMDLVPDRYERPRLVFEDGALVLKAVRKEARGLPSYFVWHAGHWVAPAYRYAELKQWLADRQGPPIINNIPRYAYPPQSSFRFERLDGLISKTVTTPVRSLLSSGLSEKKADRDPQQDQTGSLYEPFLYTNLPAPAAKPARYVAEENPGYQTTPGQEGDPQEAGGAVSATRSDSEFSPRPYQEEAIASWLALEGRGSIVLPTGAGKSLVATLAIDAVKAPTLVVVPQLDLLHQWYENLSRTYGQENIGVYFGEKKEIKPITVTTYVSASSHLAELGNRFYLLICDEVHHLTGATWQHAAKLSIAPRRLALTATYPSDFEDHLLLQELIGPPCYYKTPSDLAGEYLAEYQTVRVRVDFTPQEASQYEQLKEFYRPLAQRMYRLYGRGWYQQLMRHQNRQQEYRQALLYKARMEELIEQASSKRLTLARILALHRGQSAIIFTESNRVVYELSELFLIPAITHHTPARERKAILDGFRSGEFPAIVTAKVLNEGVDLPTAKVAVIVGGGASSTEYIQRLGRILRRQGGARAFLYELIVKGTLEEGVSSRRRQVKKETLPQSGSTLPTIWD
ncbi:MAG TPA: DEAD/DEAH box helicase family protein [Chloroflexia bacterium]|nr:DEAD/DEAH box helicase family protein [Chloroflexia bacterium]